MKQCNSILSKLLILFFFICCILYDIFKKNWVAHQWWTSRKSKDEFIGWWIEKEKCEVYTETVHRLLKKICINKNKFYVKNIELIFENCALK